jgi:hypothetical protein
MLLPGDILFLEVPDVSAANEGPGLEEYFIENHHVFSPSSLLQCGESAGLSVLELEPFRESSGKFSLRIFFGCAPSL